MGTKNGEGEFVMPKKLLDCVKQTKKKGVTNPWGICIASTGLHPHKVKVKNKTKYQMGVK